MSSAEVDLFKSKVGLLVCMWRRVWAMRLIRFAAERLTPATDVHVRGGVYGLYLAALAWDMRKAKEAEAGRRDGL